MMSFQSRTFPIAQPGGHPFVGASKSDGTVCIVVPCYNEARRLDPQAFLQAIAEADDLRFLFVNDGSRDQTIALLTDLARRGDGRIDVLDLARNGGKAEAVRQGLLAAIEAGHEVIGYWDADLATPLDAIGDFVRVMRRLPEVDVVFGSRRMLPGHRIERQFGRRVISRICATLARLAIGQPVGDTQCGAKLLRVTEGLSESLSQPFSAGWLFDVELFSRLATHTTRPERAFYEQPLVEWTEIPGSKVTGRAVIASGFRMLRLIGVNRFGLFAPQTMPRAANLNRAVIRTVEGR